MDFWLKKKMEDVSESWWANRGFNLTCHRAFHVSLFWRHWIFELTPLLAFLLRLFSRNPKKCVRLFSNKISVLWLIWPERNSHLWYAIFYNNFLASFTLLVTSGQWLCLLPTSLPQTRFLYLQASMQWTAMLHHWEDTNLQQNVSTSFLIYCAIFKMWKKRGIVGEGWHGWSWEDCWEYWSNSQEKKVCIYSNAPTSWRKEIKAAHKAAFIKIKPGLY